jgi:hypothetical protein
MTQESASTKPRVGVVGPCKSGKSTLVRGLQQAGYTAFQIAQEHSFAPSMWLIIGKPDVLIFLTTEYETTVERGLKWLRRDYDEQQPRLANAREHADLTLATDTLPPEQILQTVLGFIAKH